MKCKICGNETKIINDEAREKIYLKCSTCEAIALKDEFFVSTENEKGQYDNHNNNIENSGYVKMFENFLDFFGDTLKDEVAEALDFGSGPGPVLSKIMENRALHVDIFDKFYQPCEIYKDKSYDLITSTEVFEHLKNPLETLLLFKKHLKKDGVIAIMTLFHNNDTEEFLNWWYRRDPTHILFYTPKTFEVMCAMCGLKILKTDHKRIIVLTSSK